MKTLRNIILGISIFLALQIFLQYKGYPQNKKLLPDLIPLSTTGTIFSFVDSTQLDINCDVINSGFDSFVPVPEKNFRFIRIVTAKIDTNKERILQWWEYYKDDFSAIIPPGGKDRYDERYKVSGKGYYVAVVTFDYMKQYDEVFEHNNSIAFGFYYLPDSDYPGLNYWKGIRSDKFISKRLIQELKRY